LTIVYHSQVDLSIPFVLQLRYSPAVRVNSLRFHSDLLFHSSNTHLAASRAELFNLRCHASCDGAQ